MQKKTNTTATAHSELTRKFTRGLSKPGTAAELRQSVSEVVRTSVLVGAVSAPLLLFLFSVLRCSAGARNGQNAVSATPRPSVSLRRRAPADLARHIYAVTGGRDLSVPNTFGFACVAGESENAAIGSVTSSKCVSLPSRLVCTSLVKLLLC
ncbi:hypothetical protein SKAU_G00253960 [Synaphobranchus kaupii]|uniref:Uncharacterized protein n=1 Tax=Synaphobranchus kaupii TaxID=118154 RepID=A0A9Q1F3I1_SYNKA|nr:hypothetical protein SKAU_G00253960 [Synaphobranchus kaupii]